MFSWSWLAGYLQRGLGIPPAGGMWRWRDGRGGEGGGERESVAMCLRLPDINSERMLAYCPPSTVAGVLLKGLNHLRCMKKLEDAFGLCGILGIRGRVTKHVTLMEVWCIILVVH